MRASIVSSASVGVIVGFGGSLAIVLAAAESVGATQAQTISWVTAMCLAVAATSVGLSAWYRIPIVTAWSTPGAVVIAATSSVGIADATGAFVFAGVLIMLTATIRPLGRLVERIPVPLASAMLAGVLLRFVVPVFDSLKSAPYLVAPLLAAFLLLRLVLPAATILVLLAGGAALSVMMGLGRPWPTSLSPPSLEFVAPVFDPATVVGLGLPLYLVTMAGQNLPGAAVLRQAGYAVPMAAALAATGLASVVTAPAGAHTCNLAAITAAICTGPDVHPDPARRWPVGVVYGLGYVLVAALADYLVALFLALPGELLRTVAGLALIGSLTGALGSALAVPEQRFAAVLTFAVTASGLSVAGIGSPFWGLAAGLVAMGLDGLVRVLAQRN
jgi:benzoate membrane transport protein